MTAGKLPSRQDHKAATFCLSHRQLAQGCGNHDDRAGSGSLYEAHGSAGTGSGADAMETSALWEELPGACE
jgi:hypothetical protein